MTDRKDFRDPNNKWWQFDPALDPNKTWEQRIKDGLFTGFWTALAMFIVQYVSGDIAGC